MEGQGHFLPYSFKVLYVLCFTRPIYQVSVHRTIGPLVIDMCCKMFVFGMFLLVLGFSKSSSLRVGTSLHV